MKNPNEKPYHLKVPGGKLTRKQMSISKIRAGTIEISILDPSKEKSNSAEDSFSFKS